MDDEDTKNAVPSDEKKDKQETPSNNGEEFAHSLKKSILEILESYPKQYIKSVDPQIVINIEKFTNVETNAGGIVGDNGQIDIGSVRCQN